jgi:diguanylate cyclase (GGDEF)-like protein
LPRASHVALLAAVVLVVYSVWNIGGWSHGTALLVIADLTSLALTMTAAVFAGLAAWAARGRLRAAWTALTVGLIGWAAGDAIWAYHELVLNRFPFPSAADAAYLVLPIGACTAMLLFPSARSMQSPIRLVLDGVIVATALFLVSWFTVLRPVYGAGAESRLATAISLAYPASDLLVLTVSAYVLVRSGSYQRPSLILFTLGMTCIALSDSVFVYLAANGRYSSGDPIDIGWVAGVLLITVAAAVGRGDRTGERDPIELPSWASVWLPYAPLLAAGIVAAAQPVESLRSATVQLATVVLVVSVLARQFLTVGENRKLVATVAEQALRDPLTGLANRDLFQDRLNHAMQLRRRDGRTVGMLVVDLNDFKLVNDTLGHPAGDELLIGSGARILGCARIGDTVARVGGDEFAVLVEADADQCHLIAHRLVAAFDLPFLIEGEDLLMRPSVGLAIADGNDADLSAEDLYKRADKAMYSAKRSGVGGVTAYTPELESVSALMGKETGAGLVRFLGQLRHAIDHSQLDLVFQPQFDLRTGKIVGVEALLRWPHPEQGMLVPEEFLPLVRRHGLMGRVNDFVLSGALDEAMRWRSAGADLPVGVNLSAPAIADLSLPDRISRELRSRGLTATAVTVEVTEDVIVSNSDSARIVLNQLRESGTRVSIDDFGSGYSALSYLRDLPVDEVKLDRSFISSILFDGRAAAVVSAVVELAHSLGLTAVAEGVENAATADRLRELGCDVGQGFYFSAPLTADGMLDAVAADPVSLPVRR